MKENYYLKSEYREISPEDNVLLFLPIHKAPLQSQFCGPFKVKRKINYLNYVIVTPNRRKKERLVHVNLLKPYYVRNHPEVCLSQNTIYEDKMGSVGEKDSFVLENLEDKLSHLSK